MTGYGKSQLGVKLTFVTTQNLYIVSNESFETFYMLTGTHMCVSPNQGLGEVMVLDVYETF